MILDRAVEKEQIRVAKKRGQVIHPIDSPSVQRGLRAANHSARRRARKTVDRLVRRGVIR